MRLNVFRHYCYSLLVAFLAINSGYAASVETEIDALLEKKIAPVGVVFEIVSRKDEFLDWAIPKVTKSAKRLRESYPNVSIAVVTHGREQFALTSRNEKKHNAVHKQVRSLVADNITVHVCGTNANRHGVSAEDFPDYIDVSPAGPAQINDYLNLGYTLIQIKRVEP